MAAVPAVPEQVAPGVAPPAEPTLLERIANADPAAGERTAGFCTLCHTLGAGVAAGVGPNLYDIVGALAGRDPAFAYSAAIVALRAEGATWTYDRLDAFLLDPQAAVPGTGMTAAVRNDADRINLIAYLRTLSPSPVPVTARPGVRVPGLAPVGFTAEQVEAGRIRYAQCARCHAVNLRGDFHGSRIGFAPTLIGDRFADRWFERTVFDFYARMEGVYLADYNGAEEHGGRSPETYVALIAYILERNGFAAGAAPLPLEREALERVGFWQ